MLANRQRHAVGAEPRVEHPAGHRRQGVGPTLVGRPLVPGLARGGAVERRHHGDRIGGGQQGMDPRHRVRGRDHPHAAITARLGMPSCRGLGVQRELGHAHVGTQLRDGALVGRGQDTHDHRVGRPSRQVLGLLQQHLDLAHRDRPLVEHGGQPGVAPQTGRQLDLALRRPARDREPGGDLVGQEVHLGTARRAGGELGDPLRLLPRSPRADPLPGRHALDQGLTVHRRRLERDQSRGQTRRRGTQLELGGDRVEPLPGPGHARHRGLRSGHGHRNTSTSSNTCTISPGSDTGTRSQPGRKDRPGPGHCQVCTTRTSTGPRRRPGHDAGANAAPVQPPA